MLTPKRLGFYIFLASLALLTACPTSVPTTPVGFTLDPAQASVGVEVTATLEGMDGTRATVSVAGITAEIAADSTGSVTFVVPPNTNTGEQTVKISSNGKQAENTLEILGPELDRDWAARGESVTIDLGDVSGQLENPTVLLDDGDKRTTIDDFTIDGETVTFPIPVGTRAVTQSVVVRASGLEVRREISVAGDDVISGEVILILDPGTDETTLETTLTDRGFGLLDENPHSGSKLRPLGAADGLCSAVLGVATYDTNQAPLGLALRQIRDLLEDDLYDFGGILSSPELGPIRTVDPRTGYQVSNGDPLAAIGAHQAHDRGLGGAGVTIAVLDTGVSAHPELDGRLLPGYDFIDEDDNPEDTFDDPATGFAQDGHGTPIAVLAAGDTLGVANAAHVLPVRTCDTDGTCPAENVIEAICFALSNAPDGPENLVVNLSFGSETRTRLPMFFLFDAVSQGALISVAAGNEGQLGSPEHFPAAYGLDGVLAVAALEHVTPDSWEPAESSTRGFHIDVSAPGEALISGTPAGDLFGDDPTEEGYSGTSFSSALGAGALALWRQVSPALEPFEVESALKAAAAPLPFPAVEVGSGMIDLSTEPFTEPGNGAPIITSFGASPNPVDIDASTSFTWSFTDPDGSDTHVCTLDHGDATPPTIIDPCASGAIFNHTYTDLGTFDATLTVEDQAGLSDMFTVQVEVIEPIEDRIDCGSLVSGTILLAGETDTFRFTGATGDVVALTLVETSNWGGSFGDIDARGSLFSPTGVALSVFDSNTQPEFTLPETGTYILRVTANNLVSTGSYNLGLACIQPVDSDATELALGDLLSGSIDDAGEADLYVFTGTAGDVIAMTIVETSNWGGSFGDIDAQLTLFTSAGEQLVSYDSNTQPEYTLPGTDTYVLRVTANNLVSAGTYNLGIEGLAPTSPSPTPIALGDLLSGSIDDAGEADLYVFTGTAGDVIAMTIVETSNWGGSFGDIDAQLTLFTSAGEQLLAFDSNAQQEYTLLGTDTYVLRVTANNLVSIGTYNLGLEGR